MTTHNWGRAARFCRALGFELELETDHGSGQLRNGDGPYVFVAEVPEGEDLGAQLVLRVADDAAFEVDPALEAVSGFDDTHDGTREMVVRDPDGRTWSLQASARPDPRPRRDRTANVTVTVWTVRRRPRRTSASGSARLAATG